MPLSFRVNRADEIHSLAVIGALLGTQTGREVAVVNTFELVAQRADVAMEGGAAQGVMTVDADFLTRRSEQCECGSAHSELGRLRLISMGWPPVKQVFPTLDLVGWYTIGEKPDSTHVQLQRQVSRLHCRLCRTPHSSPPGHCAVPILDRIAHPAPALPFLRRQRCNVIRPPTGAVRVCSWG